MPRTSIRQSIYFAFVCAVYFVHFFCACSIWCHRCQCMLAPWVVIIVNFCWTIHWTCLFSGFWGWVKGFSSSWIVMLLVLPCIVCYFIHWPNCTFPEGNYLINYLATRGADLEPFVLGSLIQLFCRITKFGWLDDDRFRDVVKEGMNFLSQVIWHVFWT